MRTYEQRLMDKVTKAENGCWIWFGAHNFEGYGFLSIEGKRWGAHRFSYHIFKGDIPAGMYVCHKCDCPPCVNPEHLFLGTASDNAKDKYAKGRAYSGFRTAEERSETMREAWTRYPQEKRKQIGERIAAAKLGVPLGPEHLASIRAARAKPRSEEYRRKLGAAHKGVPSWNKGIPMREESKRKLSESKKGRIPWNKGKATPIEIRAKQSKARREYLAKTSFSEGGRTEGVSISREECHRLVP